MPRCALCALALSLLWITPLVSVANAQAIKLETIINLGTLGSSKLQASSANNTYDYVIVGAGTAGLTLAHRLAQDRNTTVVVLEAGHDLEHDATAQLFAETPGFDVLGCGASLSDVTQNSIDWKIVTTPQQGCNNRKVRYARGKTAGGTSQRNFMIYQRPSVETHATWQKLTGSKEWGYVERELDYQRPLTFTPARQDLRRDNPAIPSIASDFGSSDPDSACVQITFPNQPQQFSGPMLEAIEQAGTKRSESFTDGSTLQGIQFGAAAIDPVTGHRSTSRCFYKRARDWRNFKVIFKARAKTIILTRASANSTARAQGVTYSTNPSGEGVSGTVYARKEVILCGGVFNSPQLLIVSGIGPKAELEKHGIIQVVINDNVGKDMQDHVYAGPSYRVKPKIQTLTNVAVDPVFVAKQTALFLKRPPRGILTNNVADVIGFERVPDTELRRMGLANLSSNDHSWPHIEPMSAPGLVKNFDNLYAENLAAGADGSRFVSILMALQMPMSRGSVTLSSGDTADLPIVDPGWLTHPVDQKIAVYAYKRARHYFRQEPIRRLLLDNGTEYFPGPSVQTDEEILSVIRDTAMTVWHAACTCSMRRRELGGVLDDRLRVYDVDALRVVDASSFPRLLPGHPTSVIYMLAERAATLIKEDNP